MRAPLVAALVLAAMLVPAFVAGAAVDDTTLVSLTGTQERANGHSGPGIAVSASGNRIAFESSADNLSDIDDNAVVNIFVRDMGTGITDAGEPERRRGGERRLREPGDLGRRALSSRSSRRPTTSATPTTTPVTNVFLHDIADGTTELVSQGSDGAAGGRRLRQPVGQRRRSADGGRLRVAWRRTSAPTTTMRSRTSSRATSRRARPRSISRVNGSRCGRQRQLVRPLDLGERDRGSRSRRMPTTSSPTTATSTRTSSWSSRGFRLLTHVSRTTAPRHGERAGQRQLHAARDLRQRRLRRVHLERHEPRRVTAPSNVFLRYLQANNTSLVSRAAGPGRGRHGLVVAGDLRGRAAGRVHVRRGQPLATATTTASRTCSCATPTTGRRRS